MNNLTNSPLLVQVVSFANRDLLKLRVRGNKKDGNWEEDRAVITSKIFKRIHNKCPKLYHLELESIVSFALTIQKLPKNLRHLGFRQCQFSFFYLFMRKNCKKGKNNSRLDEIRCLDLSYSINFDSQCCILCNKFPQLRYLYLEGLFRVNNGGIFWLDSSLLQSLYVLSIEGTEVTSEIFIYVVKSCGSLVEFYFGNTYIDSNIVQLKKEKVVAKNLARICIYNLDLNTNSLNFLNEILPALTELQLNSQLHSQVKSDDALSCSLQMKMNVKEIKEPTKTCLHFKEHACDRYKKLPAQQ